MRSLTMLRTTIIAGAAVFLSGCLVSEEPVLDAATGRATPMPPGAYVMCQAEGEDDDCSPFEVTQDASGLYLFKPAEESPAEMRFRRIGRKGYAVQSKEDDGYAYYYGRGDAREFRLTMMMCSDLPEGLRARLIDRGHLEAEEGDADVCTVKTLRGLTDSARAYHRGDSVSDDGEELAIVFTPAPAQP